MKNQLREDMNKEPSGAPVIEVLYEQDDALVGWGLVVEGEGIDTGAGIIDLSDAVIHQIRIAK